MCVWVLCMFLAVVCKLCAGSRVWAGDGGRVNADSRVWAGDGGEYPENIRVTHLRWASARVSALPFQLKRELSNDLSGSGFRRGDLISCCAGDKITLVLCCVSNTAQDISPSCRPSVHQLIDNIFKLVSKFSTVARCLIVARAADRR